MILCAQCGTPAIDGVAGCPACGSLLRTDDPAQVGARGDEPDADFADVGGRLDEAALQQATRIGMRYIECTPDGGVCCRFEMGSAGGNFVAWLFLLLFGALFALWSFIAFALYALIALGVAALFWQSNTRPPASVLYADGRFVPPAHGRGHAREIALGLPLQFAVEQTGNTYRDGSPVCALRVTGRLADALIAGGPEADMRAIWREYLRRFDALAQREKSAQRA